MRKFILFTIFFILSISIKAQKTAADQWVDSVYESLTDTQRLGQLFMIRAHSNWGWEHVAEVEELIRKYNIGGLCFFQGTPERQIELTNRYQALTHVPLLISMDAEWGLNMRLKESTIAYPKQLMLGAIQDNKLIYRFGQEVARECHRLGVHINFAPVADVNLNPNNQIINDRSFGEDKFNVAAKCYQYMLGLQDNGVMACAKHFPGHGDTDVDSHYNLPSINKSLSSLNDLELLPFKVLSQHGIGSCMVGHLQVDAIDSTVHTPMSLSKNGIRKLLREQIGYEGLIFTDGLDMRGITRYYTNGIAEAKALEAGVDMLCVPESVSAAFTAIKRYISEGKIDTLQIQASVKRILHAKYQYGLTGHPFMEPYNVRNDINSTEGVILKKELIQNALTLVRDNHQFLPFKNYQPDSMATLSLGVNHLTAFQSAMNNYGITNQFNISKDISDTKRKEMLDYFSKKKVVIVGLHDMRSKASDKFGLSSDVRDFVSELNKVTKVVLVVFGNPYALKYFDDVKTVLECYNEDKLTQEAAAEGLFGIFNFKGKLPITACESAKCGMGIYTETTINRLKWNTTNPEALGVNPTLLAKIDNIANELIEDNAAPGCQILVAKDGNVVYHKAFGYHTYDKTQPCTTDDIYDLASITKCAATTISLMKLYEEGKLDINEKMSTYLPILRGSNKENMLIKDVMVHQAGLKAWIPFYKSVKDLASLDGKSGDLNAKKWFSESYSDTFTVQVADKMYMRSDYVDSMKMQIVQSPLNSNHHYLYSDLGFILLADVVKNISGKTLDEYVKDNFYTPLSMSHTLFNPLSRFDKNAITPTENDKYFRMQRIHGHVHDMAAAMLGGVGGHAGLFSTTADLATLMQMLLNGGEYGGVRYLQPETIKLFTTRQEGSTRRGYGWDMKDLNTDKKPNVSPLTTSKTFGHTGFTGNAFYADPENNLIYIFLSNRTYPDMNNNKLINGNYRNRIQSVIYEAISK